jgi:hypothetical protein
MKANGQGGVIRGKGAPVWRPRTFHFHATVNCTVDANKRAQEMQWSFAFPDDIRVDGREMSEANVSFLGNQAKKLAKTVGLVL